ncbi:MAG: hypothetical protein ACI9XO_000149, partial [Paraglaciecola sp.]
AIISETVVHMLRKISSETPTALWNSSVLNLETSAKTVI